MNMQTTATARTKAKRGSDTRIEDAFRKIKQLIFEQKFVPGQKLVYDDLAKILEMSRTPVINALNRLEQQGLVVSESRRGFYVRPMDLQEAWDAFGVREALETYAVEQAILQGVEDDFQRLEEQARNYVAYEVPYYDRRKVFLDAAFHIQIAEMAKNRILKWHLKVNLEHLYLRARLDDYDANRMADASGEHQVLINKMRHKDVKSSVDIIRSHIRADRDHVMTCLSDDKLKSGGFEL